MDRQARQSFRRTLPLARKWNATAVIIVLSGLLAGCASQVAFRQREVLSDRLRKIDHFAVIYRHVPLEQLAPFGLVILEADAYSEAEIRFLRLEGKLVLAYLNIGEIEQYRSFAREVKKSWILGANPDWPDHSYVRPGERGWHWLLRNQRVRPLLDKGLDGFLLDSVDLVAPGRYPAFQKDMVRLIEKIRSWAPGAVLLANNALFFLDKIAPAIDGVLMEDLFNMFNENGNSVARSDAERFANLKRVLRARARWHLPFFLVDYCPESGVDECREIEAICRANGLPHFCTDRNVSRIYPQLYRPGH